MGQEKETLLGLPEDFSKENIWNEVGEISMDGENWNKFLK